jgi:hypothetical protein
MNGIIPALLNKKGDTFEISSLIVDDRAKETRDMYYAFNMPVVKRQYYDRITELSGGNLAAAGERIRKESQAEKNAAARNFVMDLSRIKSNEDLIAAANAYNKSGNQQIALPIEFFQNKKDDEIKALVLEMSKNGTRVFAIMDKTSKGLDNYNLQARFINYGFAGYLFREGGKISYLRDYTFDKESDVAEISGFQTENDLIKQIESAEIDSVKVINVESYIDLIANERDIAAKIENLVGFFGGKILTLFSFNRKITPDFAVKKALEIDMGIIADVSSFADPSNKNVSDIFSALEKYIAAKTKLSSDEDKIVSEIKQKFSSIPEIELFLNRIKSSNANLREDADKATDAFIKTLFKKMKVKYDTDGLGLQNKELERLMVNTALSGKPGSNEISQIEEDIKNAAIQQAFPEKLLQDLISMDFMEQPSYSARDIINGKAEYRVKDKNGVEKVINISAELVYSTVEVRSKEIYLRDQFAAADVYELLLLYAERRREYESVDKDNLMQIDTKAVMSILSAA